MSLRILTAVLWVLGAWVLATACVSTDAASGSDDPDPGGGREVRGYDGDFEAGPDPDVGTPDGPGADAALDLAAECDTEACECARTTEICNGVDDNCDGVIDEGFNLQTDPDNCGRCGEVCAAIHAVRACAAGVCEVGACEDGYGDCDGVQANGCETSLDAPTGCGDCTRLGGSHGSPCGACGIGLWRCREDGSIVCEGASEAVINGCGGCTSLDGEPGERCGTCDTGQWTCIDPELVVCAGDIGGAALDDCGECWSPDSCTPTNIELGAPCGTAGTEQRVCGDSCSWGDWTCEETPRVCAPGESQTEERPCGDCGEGRQTRVRNCAADGAVWGEWRPWATCETAAACRPGDAQSEDRACGACGEASQSRTRACSETTCQWSDWGEWTACTASSECAPGETQSQDEPCGNCNRGRRSRSRSCDAESCRWGPWGSWTSCSGGGVCAAGARRDSASCDPCSQQVCNSSCDWGDCELRVGAQCEWESGSNWRCCGSGQWQFCLGPRYGCIWSPDCEACSGCAC